MNEIREMDLLMLRTAKEGDLNSAERVHGPHAQEKLSAECHFSYFSYGSIWKGKEIQEFRRIQSSGSEPSALTYQITLKTFVEMQRADLWPNVVSLTLLVNANGKARREDEALHVFEEMPSAGVRTTQKAYNILLDAFAVSGMVEPARIVSKSMRRDRCTPDLCSYTTMLSAYINASDLDGAEKFFRRLKQDGLSPNEVTYGALIKGYAKANLKKMMAKYEELRSSGIRANQTVLTTIMAAYGKNKDFNSPVIWYKEMEPSGFAPDKKVKNMLLIHSR